MLHLDQNHTSLSSPHSKPSVILSNTPRTDQHNLLSWSNPNRDERPPFFQESQEQPVAEKTSTPPIKPDVPAASTETPTEPAAATGSTAPGNAEDSKLSDQPPSTPDATSPALESTSSLTPPPSTTSPAFSSVELPDGDSSAQPKVEGTEEEEQTKADIGDKASRASTPLSELSSAPEGDDPSAPEKTAENEEEKHGADGASAADTNANRNDTTSGKNHASSSSAETNNVNHPLVGADQRIGSRAPSIATPEPAAVTASASGSSKKSDPRVDAILELNAELLRVCMEFQVRGVKWDDPKAAQYCGRLQSNLTWMATAADERSKSTAHTLALPVLQPPPPLEFTSVERIHQLYKELPELFSKDIIRRQSMSNSSAHSNGHLKRDRPEDATGDVSSAHKRRDTGESKTSTPAPSTPLSNSSPIQPISASMAQPGTPTHPVSAPNMVGPSNSSPSMPPPSVPPGMMPPVNEAQVVARERARQMQMRQAMQQGMGDGGRPMPSGPSQPGGMPMSGSSSMSPATMAALSAMGPTAVQCFQILQNPQHPLVQYMITHSSGFQTLPLQQQIQQMQKVQMMMQARSQQQRAASGQMSGMQGLSQASGGPGAMGVPNGSPTRMSPSGQQSSMQQQGGFPFPGGGGGGHSGMDPRMSNAMGLTPAQQANLASMNPQQRQLFLLQQQQMMRGGNASNAAMMNQQMYNAAQQQRIAGSSPHMGSPMLGGATDGANFPAALRSNPGVPGIARSARTPSDHAPSPMTPQLSQRGSGSMEDFQRVMMQQAQAQRNMAQGGGGMNQMGMGNVNAAWPQSQPNQMQPNQGSYGPMSPPGSASGYGGMPGGSPSIGGQQQWSPNASAPYPFNTGSPSANHSVEGTAPGSRQASATPAPHQQQQVSQNSPLPGADQSGLNDFDIFDWGQ